MKFSDAAHIVRSGTFEVTDVQRLQLYGMYKYAITQSKPPGTPPILDVIERSKWNAWNDISTAMSPREAKHAYIKLVRSLANTEPDPNV